MNRAGASPFDALAAGYDRDFTEHPTGRLMREAVWAHLDRRFHAGQRILELNCGTGADAVHLAQRGISVVATDASAEMTAAATAKVARCGVATFVQVRGLAWEEIGALDEPHFDGFLSNFGGINCVADIAGLIPALAACLKPGAAAFVCGMGPYCLWEWLWYVAHGDPRKAFRRFTRGGVRWRGTHILYPSIRELGQHFSSHFRIVRVTGLGVILPPPFAADLTARYPRLTDLLNRWERRWEAVPPLPALADHYLIEFERM